LPSFPSYPSHYRDYSSIADPASIAAGTLEPGRNGQSSVPWHNIGIDKSSLIDSIRDAFADRE
jgi:hypothetical protein